MAGQMVHVEIPAGDTAKARAFWGGLFGWQFEPYPGPSEYHMARFTETTGGAISNMEPGKRGTRTYFAADDINAGAARVRELGGEVVTETTYDSGPNAVCKDVQGREFQLWQPAPGY